MSDTLPDELARAWADLPDALRAHPGIKRLHALAARQQAQAFEAYFAESRRSRGPSKRPTFERREDGTYKDDHTQRHWWTWQQAQAQVPDCWVLVPVEPTPEMVRAADNYAFVTKQRPKGMWWWGRVYEAMLAASPKAAQPEPQPEPLCDCGAKPVSACDKWEPNCGLGQSQEHARVVRVDLKPEQAQQSEREAFEKLAAKTGGMTNYQLFLAGVAHAEASILARLEAVPVPEPDGKVAHEGGLYELPWISSEDAFSEEAFVNYRAAMLAAARGVPAPAAGATSSLDPDEGDAVTLWAEIHRLRAAVQGPDGYASWQGAATAERMRRVAGVKVMRQALEALETCMGVPHWPSLTPTVAALRAAISQPPVQGSGS